MSADAATCRVRVLSGTHAGAALDLASGNHLIGASEDCDIFISDWPSPPLVLQTNADGNVLWQHSDSTQMRKRFGDFLLVDFAGLLVCFGPCAGAWPADDVLRKKVQRQAAASGSKLRRRVGSGLLVVVIALAGAGWLMSAHSQPRGGVKPTLETSRAVLQRLVDQVLPNRLRVAQSQDELVVDGIVDTIEQVRMVDRAISAASQPFVVERHFTAASAIAETIRSAVGLPGATVVYRGARVFDFSVQTADVEAARAAVERVAADLASVVRRIDISIQESPQLNPPLPATLSSLTSDSVSVLETRDGTKHLVMSEHPSPHDMMDDAVPEAFGPDTEHLLSSDKVTP